MVKHHLGKKEEVKVNLQQFKAWMKKKKKNSYFTSDFELFAYHAF